MKTSLATAFLPLFLLTACGKSSSTDELIGQDAPQGSPFSSINSKHDPYAGEREQVKGFYSNGSLVDADVLPAEGFGFVKIHRPRDRGWGAFDLVEILKAAAAELQNRFPSRDRVMIGDMSAKNGARLSGHASHQNGLDADVAFIRLNQTEQDVDDTGGFREHFVRNGKLTENFDLERNWAYTKILVSTGRVQRVFVGEVIKKGLCSYVKKIGELESEHETMRRLRVVAGHTGHFHVRITCPARSPECRAQEEVPESNGC